MADAERVNNEETAGVLTRFFLSLLFFFSKGRQPFCGINPSVGKLIAEREVGFRSEVCSSKSEPQQFFSSLAPIFFR